MKISKILPFCVMILLLTGVAMAEKGAGPISKYSVGTGILAFGVEGSITVYDNIRVFGAGLWGEAVEGAELMYGADFEVIYDMSPTKPWSLYISGGANYEWIKSPITTEKALEGGVGFGIAKHWATTDVYLGWQPQSVGSDDHEVSLRLIIAL